MARRHPPPDPELAALARDRLAHVLGERPAGARRAARVLEELPVGRDGAAPVAGVASAVDVEGEPSPVGLDDLEAPRRFTRWHLGVVAAVLLVGVVWGGWSWFRARPEAVAAPTTVQTAQAGPTGSAAAPGPVPPPGTPGTSSAGVAPSSAGSTARAAPSAGGPVVHVLGAVKHPGLVRLAPGARVQDALDAAGGLRHDADPAELNLAERLDDGVQVVVGTRSHPAGEVRSGGGTAAGPDGSSDAGATSGSPSSPTSAGGVVDLNSADLEQLDSLPGVGPVTAQKILDWRQQHGRFSRAEELQEVDGIGPKTYARIAPHVRV